MAPDRVASPRVALGWNKSALRCVKVDLWIELRAGNEMRACVPPLTRRVG